MENNIYVVFDVESIGLHGEGFAVGAVVINAQGDELARVLYSCPPRHASGTQESREWVSKNIPALKETSLAPLGVRNDFWSFWMSWKEHGAILVADCAWPVEARFLNMCVADRPNEREWQGPYPLIDLCAILLANGDDPLGKFSRMESELPEHNPLADARQSARILLSTLNYINTQKKDRALFESYIIKSQVAEDKAVKGWEDCSTELEPTRRENEKMREALQRIATQFPCDDSSNPDVLARHKCEQARQALSTPPTNADNSKDVK